MAKLITKCEPEVFLENLLYLIGSYNHNYLPSHLLRRISLALIELRKYYISMKNSFVLPKSLNAVINDFKQKGKLIEEDNGNYHINCGKTVNYQEETSLFWQAIYDLINKIAYRPESIYTTVLRELKDKHRGVYPNSSKDTEIFFEVFKLYPIEMFCFDWSGTEWQGSTVSFLFSTFADGGRLGLYDPDKRGFRIINVKPMYPDEENEDMVKEIAAEIAVRLNDL